MKHKSSSPKALGYAVTILAALTLLSVTEEPNILDKILNKLHRYSESHVQEKLYVHLNKPVYAAGDDVWFKIYLVNASLHTPDSQSRVVYVDLMSDSALVARRALYVSQGTATGDISLPQDLPQGNYILRAYTNHMKNTGEDFFFTMQLPVVDPLEGSNKQRKYDVNSLSLRFFPEGGSLIACGKEVNVGFEAIGPDGRSIYVEGEIFDERNVVVSRFTTQHEGMGKFSLLPHRDKKYFARILKPYHLPYDFALPQVTEGVALSVKKVGANIIASIFSSVDSGTPMNIVIQSRGKSYYVGQVNMVKAMGVASIPVDKLPDGIAQVMVFDNAGTPVAERLVFTDHQELLSVDAVTSAKEYGKRSLVKVDMESIYDNGAAATGEFSVSVYEHQAETGIEKSPLTISDYLRLTSELRGRIANPGYYFKDNLPETANNLDLLMMIHGWRRFTWKDVLSDTVKPEEFKFEKGIAISGKVQKAPGTGSVEQSVVKITTMKGHVAKVSTDSEGNFYSDDFLYYDSVDIVLQTENSKGNKKDYACLLNQFSPVPPVLKTYTSFEEFDAALYPVRKSDVNSDDVRQLKPVEVTASRISTMARDQRLLGTPTDVFVIGNNHVDYRNIWAMIQNKVPGLAIQGTPPRSVKYRGKVPAFLLNGATVDVLQLGYLHPSMVKSIEVIRGAGASVYGSSAAINVTLNEGSSETIPIGIKNFRYPGLYRAREFYTPDYRIKNDSQNLQDIRTTLYWNPFVSTDSYGRASFSFYTADVKSNYRIVIEGITAEGVAGSGTTTFTVK